MHAVISGIPPIGAIYEPPINVPIPPLMTGVWFPVAFLHGRIPRAAPPASDRGPLTPCVASSEVVQHHVHHYAGDADV